MLVKKNLGRLLNIGLGGLKFRCTFTEYYIRSNPKVYLNFLRVIIQTLIISQHGLEVIQSVW